MTPYGCGCQGCKNASDLDRWSIVAGAIFWVLVLFAGNLAYRIVRWLS